MAESDVGKVAGDCGEDFRKTWRKKRTETTEDDIFGSQVLFWIPTTEPRGVCRVLAFDAICLLVLVMRSLRLWKMLCVLGWVQAMRTETWLSRRGCLAGGGWLAASLTGHVTSHLAWFDFYYLLAFHPQWRHLFIMFMQAVRQVQWRGSVWAAWKRDRVRVLFPERWSWLITVSGGRFTTSFRSKHLTVLIPISCPLLRNSLPKTLSRWHKQKLISNMDN